MKTRIDKSGYRRTIYHCPGCGKVRCDNHGMCRECFVKSVGRDIVRGKKCGTYKDARGYDRPLYECLKCGKVKKHEGGMCRACSDKYRIENRKPKPICIHCGNRTKSRFKNVCEVCRVRIWKQAQRKHPRDECIDCKCKKDHKSNIPRCRRCHGMHLKDVYMKTHGDLPQDRDIVDAGKLTWKVRKCPDCGAKITTKECVRCVTLRKIGAKGFV